MGTRKGIVVGAGLAGLTAAYRLRQAGWEVVLLEAAREVGGRAVSVRKDGYLFDSGAVGLGTVYRDYMALVDEVGFGDRVVKSTTVSATVRGGTLHEIDTARPLTALTSRLFTLRSKLTLARLFRDLAKVKPHLDIRDVAAAADFDDEDVETYARRRLNPELLEYFIEPLARTVNLTRARNVSRLEVMNSLAGLFDTTMVTLRGGVGEFAQKLAEGVDTRLSATVLRVEEQADGVAVRYREAAGTECTEAAEVCVVATTLHRALELHPPSRETWEPLARRLRYNRGLCVHLGYAASTRTKALIAMMPPSEHPEIALFFLEHNKGPDRAPAGHSMITTFFDDTAADRPWALDDAALIRETADTLETLMPELKGRLAMGHVTRWPEGVTNPAAGLYKAMRDANRGAAKARRVRLAGDFRSTCGQNSAVAWGNNVGREIVRDFS